MAVTGVVWACHTPFRSGGATLKQATLPSACPAAKRLLSMEKASRDGI